MISLLNRCLDAEYTHTECSGDYAIQIEGKTLYLLFQWSDSAADWKNNFDFPAKAYKHGIDKWFCHRGFLKVWKAIRDRLEPRVLSILQTSNIDNIICVGYSHGAAIAGLATEDMAFRLGSEYKIAGYGFGCPRFVWGVLPREVKERFKHFVPVRNIPDIVTHVPPFILGYRHGGKLHRIGAARKYGAIQAHYAEHYIAELEKDI